MYATFFGTSVASSFFIVIEVDRFINRDACSDLGKHFEFKDKIVEVEKQSLVVNHKLCSECQADYIILAHRILEHQSSKKDKFFFHMLTVKRLDRLTDYGPKN